MKKQRRILSADKCYQNINSRPAREIIPLLFFCAARPNNVCCFTDIRVCFHEIMRNYEKVMRKLSELLAINFPTDPPKYTMSGQNTCICRNSTKIRQNYAKILAKQSVKLIILDKSYQSREWYFIHIFADHPLVHMFTGVEVHNTFTQIACCFMNL